MALAPRPSCPIFPWPTASTCTFDIWARLPRKRATSELTAPTKAYLATRRQQEFVFRPDGHLLEAPPASGHGISHQIRSLCIVQSLRLEG